MQKHNFQSRLVIDKNHKPINRFYKSIKLNVNCHQLDLVAASYNHHNQIIAAGLIRAYQSNEHFETVQKVESSQIVQSKQFDKKVHSQLVLRSVFVHPDYRKIGVGKQVLSVLCGATKERLLLSCQSELIPLYHAFGFNIIDKPLAQMPGALIKEHKKGLTLMCRPNITN